MSKVYDCCIVNDEIDMLELRMNILAPVVDYFVVVEAGVTHSGLPKGHPVGDALQTPRFASFADKVIYSFAETLEGANAWEREHNQRGLIGDALRYFAQPDDWVIVGDCDEIAHPESIRFYAHQNEFQRVQLELDFYYYNFSHRVQEGWAIGMCQWGFEQYANKIRTCDFGGARTVRVGGGGWHFSYFGDAAAIMRKAKAFMHADWVDTYQLTEAKVQAALDAGVDLWGRTLQIDRVPVSDTLPGYVLGHRGKYERLGWLERQDEKTATWQS
jgi:beta-1,4-mannosyl-glycoprotein beta-1,4-N-acetylglucosaminyltransferase